METESKPSRTKGLLIALGIVAVVALAVSISDREPESNSPASEIRTTQNIGRGENAILSTGSPGEIPVAISEAALDASTKAASAKDVIGYADLVGNGQVFMVEESTSVLVIDIGLAKTQVRILEGPHIGKAGWVLFEFVRR